MCRRALWPAVAFSDHGRWGRQCLIGGSCRLAPFLPRLILMIIMAKLQKIQCQNGLRWPILTYLGILISFLPDLPDNQDPASHTIGDICSPSLSVQKLILRSTKQERQRTVMTPRRTCTSVCSTAMPRRCVHAFGHPRRNAKFLFRIWTSALP